MKIYCASKNRPDSVLFSISEGLNILIQTPEDWESYQKHKDRHNLIYQPELDGLLDCRTWIFDNSDDDWTMIIDDDVLSYKKLENIDNQIIETEISWNDLIKETEKVLSELDKDKVGMVGFNNFHKYFQESYEINNELILCQSIVINISLLRSKGFKYESYPFDGANGKKGYGEDISILCFCYSNDLSAIRINNLYIKFNNENNSITFGNEENKRKMLFLSFLYFIGKYGKCYLVDINIRKRLFQYFLMSNFNIESVKNEITNVFSYENSNFSEEEKEMKKFLVLGLIVLAGAGLMVGCSGGDDNSNNNNNGNENPNGNGNTQETVSIVGYWIGSNGWEFRFEEDTGFSDAKKPSNTKGLSADRWEINDENTEIKLYSSDELRYTLQCTLTATTLTITSSTKTNDMIGDFPIGSYTKRK